jgi:hypothetical protein
VVLGKNVGFSSVLSWICRKLQFQFIVFNGTMTFDLKFSSIITLYSSIITVLHHLLTVTHRKF